MGLILGPITSFKINGEDLTHCLSSATIAEPATPPPVDWETLSGIYRELVRRELDEAGPTPPKVIDQDGNPVRPPLGWLRNLGRS